MDNFSIVFLIDPDLFQYLLDLSLTEDLLLDTAMRQLDRRVRWSLVVGLNDTDVAQDRGLRGRHQAFRIHPTQKCLNFRFVAQCPALSADHSIRVRGSALALALHQCLQFLEQIRVLALNQRLVATQAPVQLPLLVVPPDLRRDRLSSCPRHWVIPSSQAVDEVILPLQTNPNLQGTVVIPQGWCFPQDPVL